jgi:hypothetical protein
MNDPLPEIDRDKFKAENAKLKEYIRKLEETHTKLNTELESYRAIGPWTRLKIIAEDLRVTNESADYHMKACARLREEVMELESTFNLRHKADMRAIQMWREAHPGKELTMPDHADMVIWLLQKLQDERDLTARDLDDAIGDSEFASSGAEAHQRLVKRVLDVIKRNQTKL